MGTASGGCCERTFSHSVSSMSSPTAAVIDPPPPPTFSPVVAVLLGNRDDDGWTAFDREIDGRLKVVWRVFAPIV